MKKQLIILFFSIFVGQHLLAQKTQIINKNAYPFCSIVLKAPSGKPHYHWSTGEYTLDSIMIFTLQTDIAIKVWFDSSIPNDEDDTVVYIIKTITPMKIADTLYLKNDSIILNVSLEIFDSLVWMKNNAILSQSPSFKIKEAGLYSLKYFYNGCISDVNTFLVLKDNQTLIQQTLKKDDELLIFPIPTKNDLTLVFNNSKIENIEIISAIGLIVYTKQFTNTQTSRRLDLSGIMSGIYYIKVYTDNEIIIKKIIKK